LGRGVKQAGADEWTEVSSGRKVKKGGSKWTRKRKKKKSKKKKPGRAKATIPQEVVDEYKQFINDLDRGNKDILEFKKNENITLGRKALQQTSEELKKYVKVRRQRGSNALQFERITRQEWAAAKKSAAERGKKISKAKAKAKPKAKKK